MFKKEAMTKFYKYDPDGSFHVDSEVQTAYFVFIKDFCTCVSTYWSNYLNVLRVRANATFNLNLTPSDEVYAFWWLYFNLEIEAEKLKAGNETDKSEKKPRGPHQSIDFQDDYAKMYYELENHRENTNAWKYWQAIFFDQYLHSINMQSLSSSTSVRTHKIQIPRPSGYGLSRVKEKNDKAEEICNQSEEV